MTEVPEHLLARSKAARAKAAGDGAGGGEPPAAPGEAPGTGAAASAVEPAGGSGVAPAAPAAAPAEPARPVPPYVAAARSRKRVPTFAIPVLAALPVWALIYAGTLSGGGGPEDPELALGAQVYAAQCAGCHGGGGEGGTGRPLGQVLQTFPNFADHVAWVVNGSPEKGTPYGSPDHPDGQRISQSGGYGAMPGFGGALTEEEIRAVTRYERETLGGGEPELSAGDSADGSGEEAGVQEPGGSAAGSDTNEAEAQGGDVGGDNVEQDAGGNAPSTSDDDPTQSPSASNQTDADNPGAGGGAGAGTGGQPTRSIVRRR